MTNRRDLFIDLNRGFAIVLMVIFHLAYDLNIYKFVSIKFQEGFWYWFPRFIVFEFLFCVGAGLWYAHHKDMHWNTYWKRFGKIALGALAVSLSTYIMYPKNWVYFGTLHCIAASTLLLIPFLNRPKASFFVMILLPASMLGLGITYQDLANIFPIVSIDFIPIYPWFSVVLLGRLYAEFLSKKLTLKQRNTYKPLLLLSNHSLLIYLIHQPVLFGLTTLLYKLTN